MPTTDLLEVGSVDRAIRKLLEAQDEGAATQALRHLFVEELDFEPEMGTVGLHGEGLPARAQRVAEREGVQVVAVQLPTDGRVLVKRIREALKEVREALNGDILLAAGDTSSGEWQLVYPTTRGGKEILRRIVLQRGQPHRTVVEQLSKVYGRAKQGDLRNALESAYDVEAVTREFFKQYKLVFDHAMGLITGLEEGDRRIFCQVLFNRLMFIYFLQRKGWLTFNGSTDYLHTLWKDAVSTKENFYEKRLTLLFFTALNNPRGADWDRARALLEPQIGSVPFLNGGLFSQTELDKVPGVHVPNEAIRPLLDDVFARFNFTITESTPYDIQVAVDPEMLGKVFEELVTGRHETGSYYTPRPIVSFMCREALKGYLQTEVPDLSPEIIGRYVDRDEVEGISTEQASRLLQALERITVVDPACGSGAYLLGMMQELLEAENALYNPRLVASAKSQYQMKLRIIQHNVYGVDIDEFAVNIAMLRLWLSLIVDFEGENPPPLPNLDFKIVRGDSISGPDPSVPPPNLFAEAVRRMSEELAHLKDTYSTATGEEKNDLHLQVEGQQVALTKMMEHTDLPTGSVDWQVQFAEVFERGGFDIVLANPPYVQMGLIKEAKSTLQVRFPTVYTGRADLYVYFYARALQLLRDNGMLVFVSSDKWLRAAYGAKLRQFLSTRASIWSIIDFGELPVFQAAATFPMILVAQQGRMQRGTWFCQVPSLDPPYPDVDSVIRNYGFGLPTEAVSGAEWRLTRAEAVRRFERMRVGTMPLGEYTGGRVYRGVVTGLNEAFVIDAQTREALIVSDPRSAEIIKRFVVGREIRRWSVDCMDRWLIYAYHGIEMDRYPAVLDHLRRYRRYLERRATLINHEWYELQQPQYAYFPLFEETKIVYPDIAKAARFALDTTGAYPANTVYFLPLDDLYLLGILNSDSMWAYAGAHLSVLGDAGQGGRLRFFRQFVETLPIPRASVAERVAIEGLVQKCVEGRGHATAVAEWEEEINSRVTRMYGLDENGRTSRVLAGEAPA